MVEEAFLFSAEHLLSKLMARGVKIGVATSTWKSDWEEARVYPPSPSSPLRLSSEQVAALNLFRTLRDP